MMDNLNKLSTSSQCVKYLLFVFNLLFVITGIILLSVGSVIHGVYHNYEHFLDDKYFSVPSLLIAIGLIIFFIAFFGCCGAIKENYCMILTFTSLLVIVFILEFAAGISGYVLRNSAAEMLEEKMSKSMEQYLQPNAEIAKSMEQYLQPNAEIAKAWDIIQEQFQCCGTKDRQEWVDKLKSHNKTIGEMGYVPMSCCPRVEGQFGAVECTVNSTEVYKQGCIDEMSRFIKGHAVQLGGAGLGIAFIQALGIWFSVFLARSIKRNYHTM